MTILDTTIDRFALLKWISERNAHIPMSDLEFLIGISPFTEAGSIDVMTSCSLHQEVA